MEQYAFFLDIDGTLSRHGQIHPDNKAVIQKAQQAGHFVFINTGRSYAYIPEHVFACADFDGYVCGLGADVRIHGEQVYAKNFSEKTLTDLLELFLSMPDKVSLFEGEEYVYYTRMWHDVVNGVEVREPDAFLNAHRGAKVSKFTCEPVDKKIFAPFSDVLVLYDHGSYYEMAQTGCSKARAMLLAAERLGIPKERCVAMGDSVNDEEMLSAAGIAVVMENGMESTKKLATFVTNDVEEAGVARAIERIVF